MKQHYPKKIKPDVINTDIFDKDYLKYCRAKIIEELEKIGITMDGENND